ncbi:protein kinase domain-containing protein [Haliangium sp.]|uniref:serine/threonine-protein kinase n=1 Tax=Haliangium sp. TaxID=2663208 RepID=UPI003D0DD460
MSARGATDTGDTGPGSDPVIGRVLDERYRIEAKIGGGGMGQVYRACHLRMEQPVAVKVLHADLAADPNAARRFAREARRTFRFDHPHCVRVLDFGSTPDGLLFLVMEYLTGRTAAQEVAIDGPMAPTRVVHIARQVCDALAYAHDLGFVHRDIKPENLMLLHHRGDPDFVKVLDFGLAKLFAGPDALPTQGFSVSALTREGSVFGTPEYMAPEQAMDQPLGPSADLYALGVSLYELLSATLPFTGATFTEVLARQVQDQPEPLSARVQGRALPPALEALVMECLAKDPHARPPDARHLAARLDGLRPLLAGPARASAAVAATVELVGHRQTWPAGASADGGGSDAEPAAEAYRSPPTESVAAVPETPATPTPGQRSAWHAASVMAPDSGAGLAVGRPAPRATGEVHRPRRRRAWLALAGSAAVVGVALVVLALASRQRAPVAQAAAVDAGPPAAPTVAVVPDTGVPDPPTPDPAGSEPDPADSPPAPTAATAAATADDQDDPGATDPGAGKRDDAAAERRRARRRQIDAHLAAAEAARRAGQPLKQMAEADSALRLAPGNKRAAFLLGDALLASGDTANACTYLARALRLREARAAHRRAGCGSD